MDHRLAGGLGQGHDGDGGEQGNSGNENIATGNHMLICTGKRHRVKGDWDSGSWQPGKRPQIILILILFVIVARTEPVSRGAEDEGHFAMTETRILQKSAGIDCVPSPSLGAYGY